MLIIRETAHARAGLIGNPSDGYHGKTISILLGNFTARVILYEWDRVELVLSQNDQSVFRSIDELADDVRLHGYYGGVRLIKATIKKFVEYCRREEIPLHKRNFSIRYESDIPRQVGLAGSSAIIVATLRCLMRFYGVTVPQPILPSLAISVETEELGIPAGLQDRVIQVYGGVVYMDFAREQMTRQGPYEYGRYERLDPALLPPLYVAYRADVSEPTEVVHSDLRLRYNRGDADVHDAMRRFAELAEQARAVLLAGRPEELGSLMDANFDLRRSICRIASGQLEMIDRARACGVSAKFAGSGGAIIGVCPDEATLARLQSEMAPIGCRVVRPKIVAVGEEEVRS